MSVSLISRIYNEVEVEARLQRVLLVLADNADDHGMCWPSVEKMAWKLSCSERTIFRCLSDLEAMGAIKIRHRPRRSSIYRLDLDKLPRKAPFRGDTGEGEKGPKGDKMSGETTNNVVEYPDKVSPQMDAKMSSIEEPRVTICPSYPDNLSKLPCQNVTQNHQGTITKIHHTEIPPTPWDPELAFAEFWKSYPARRRVGKPDARKAFLKHVSADNFEALIAAVDRWSVSVDWTKSDGQFIPHPSTFLNRLQWEDTEAAITVIPSASDKSSNGLSIEQLRQRAGLSSEDAILGVRRRG